MVCKEPSSSKIVGVMLNYDYFDMKKDSNITIDYGEMQTYVDFVRKSEPVFNVKKPFEMVVWAKGAVDPLYANQSIMSTMCRVLDERHPVREVAEKFHVFTSSPYTDRVYVGMGYERVKVVDPREYVGKDGRRPFREFDERLRVLGMGRYEGLAYFLKENKGKVGQKGEGLELK